MKNQKGFTLIELLIVVAIIGIIAAIAIPSLLRARVSANESQAIGDVRTMSSAQVAYSGSAFSTMGPITCLDDPWNCINGYPTSAPNFLDTTMAQNGVNKGGYTRTFVPGGTVTNAALLIPHLMGYCFEASPTTPGQTGVRSFAVDASGRICLDPGGAVLCGACGLPDQTCPTCIILQ